MGQVFNQGHALIVGVGQDLPNTIDDAKGLAHILTDEERCAYPEKQVHLLTGEEATRNHILTALDELAESTEPNSSVVIYFSGHGYQIESPISSTYYLMPFGYDIKRPRETAISGAEFTNKLQAIKTDKLLVLLDCCHAGGMADVEALEWAKAPLPPEAQNLFAQGKGRVVIASSMKNELSYAGRPYSAFTLALVEAFCGIGASEDDGYVRVNDLALHAREVVPKRTGGKQHPILNYKEADNFILAYYAGGDAKPKSLPIRIEPQIEPEPGAWSTVFDQRGQTHHGPVTNVANNNQGPILSGTFNGPTRVGGQETTNIQSVFYQPNMTVHGNSTQVQGDFHQNQTLAGKEVIRDEVDEREDRERERDG